MKTKRIVSILIIISLLLPYSIIAETTTSKTQVGIIKGESAPFSGVLFKKEKAFELLEMKNELKLQKEKRNEEKEFLMLKLKESKVPWYDKPTIRTLWGMLLAYVSVYAAAQLDK